MKKTALMLAIGLIATTAYAGITSVSSNGSVSGVPSQSIQCSGVIEKTNVAIYPSGKMQPLQGDETPETMAAMRKNGIRIATRTTTRRGGNYVVYHKNGSWYQGDIGHMGDQFNSWTINQIANYLCQ